MDLMKLGIVVPVWNADCCPWEVALTGNHVKPLSDDGFFGPSGSLLNTEASLRKMGWQTRQPKHRFLVLNIYSPRVI